jgi:hypothetical protein
VRLPRLVREDPEQVHLARPELCRCIRLIHWNSMFETNFPHQDRQLAHIATVLRFAVPSVIK